MRNARLPVSGSHAPHCSQGQAATQPTNGSGNAAQIKEIINQQIQSGEPIGPEQVAQMNAQASASIHHPRPPGVPAGMVGHGPATRPPIYPGYNDQRPLKPLPACRPARNPQHLRELGRTPRRPSTSKTSSRGPVKVLILRYFILK